jgi:(S)-3,5-dihydroxyphenylglycine transaminase
MGHFYDHDAEVHALRLSCSAVTPARIDQGLDRLADFVSAQVG